ncbi:MAG TPA: peptidylprolyl isomerase [Parasulfuritortus sp.]
MNEDIVAKNKVVYIRYTILDDGGLVRGQQDMPIGYVHGAHSGLFEEIEQSLDGHRVGDKVEAFLSPGTFGDRDPDLVVEEDIDNVPPQIRYIGAEAELQNDSGDVLTFRVTSIADGKITLDGNHVLAGRQAKCVAEILSVRDATPEEVDSGFPAEQGTPQLH